MAKKGRVGLLRRLWAETVPFVAQSPKMKVDWIVRVIKKEKLSCEDITPYMRLLIMEYENVSSSAWQEEITEEDFVDLFKGVNGEVLLKMIESTELADMPALLRLIPEVKVDDAVVILTKKPPPYEKRPQLVIDKVFKAVYDRTSGDMLEEVAGKISKSNDVSVQFINSYKRFKEIMEDEKILSSMFPKAK
jgi:hypothetical protein